MKTLLSPSHARMIDDFVAGMRRRDFTAQIHGMRLDLEVLKCELAVDAVFARQQYEPGMRRP